MADLETNLDTLARAIEKDHAGQRTRVEAALEGGAALLELKAQTQHGDFLPMVQKVGCSPRKSQRWMALAETGYTVDEIKAFGGVGKAIEQYGHQQQLGETLRTVYASLRASWADRQRGWQAYGAMFDGMLRGDEYGGQPCDPDVLRDFKAMLTYYDHMLIADFSDAWEQADLPGKPPYRVEVEDDHFISYRTNPAGDEVRGDAIPCRLDAQPWLARFPIPEDEPEGTALFACGYG